MWRPPLGQQQLHEELHDAMLPACRVPVKAGKVVPVKKLLVLVLVAVLAAAVWRRFLAPSEPAATHQHGTPDHWPPVVRKPGAEAPAAPAA